MNHENLLRLMTGVTYLKTAQERLGAFISCLHDPFNGYTPDGWAEPPNMFGGSPKDTCTLSRNGKSNAKVIFIQLVVVPAQDIFVAGITRVSTDGCAKVDCCASEFTNTLAEVIDSTLNELTSGSDIGP